jgi:hypothetical protein
MFNVNLLSPNESFSFLRSVYYCIALLWTNVAVLRAPAMSTRGSMEHASMATRIDAAVTNKL